MHTIGIVKLLAGSSLFLGVFDKASALQLRMQTEHLHCSCYV